MRISGFWMGAALCGGRVDLPDVARRVGGYAALIDGGEQALVAGGVEPAVARRWVRTPASGTSFQAVTQDQPEYPAHLREVPSAPAFLCVEGRVDALRGPGVGVVGTRACTAYGAGVAHHLGAALAAEGIAVVSGLARGIDGRAHRAALQSGTTVAVLGHGLGHTAPSQHRGLRHDIVQAGGALVSTWLDDVGPERWRFPDRNRWIAALSRAVVVVEAPVKSGARITAVHALELGRDVHAVPGRIGAPDSLGCLELIADGAAIVVSVPRLVAELAGRAPEPQVAWLERLFAGEDLSAVARTAGWSVLELLAELGRLELQGQVVRMPGQRYGPALPPRAPDP